jgi:potassium-dependent mechanosensitive channel
MSKKHPFFLFLMVCLMGVGMSLSSYALTTENGTSGKLIEYLAAEKVNLTVTNSEARSFSMPINARNIETQKKQTLTGLTLINAKIETLDGFLTNQKKKQRELKGRLKQFKQSSSSSSEALVLQESVNQVKALLSVNEKAIELITDNLVLARQYETTLRERERDLILWEAEGESARKIEAKQAEITALEVTRSARYETSIALERQKKSNLHDGSGSLLDEGTLLLNNQMILFIDHHIRVIQTEIDLIQADYVFLERGQDVKALELSLEMYTYARSQLYEMTRALTNMKDALAGEQVILFSDASKRTSHQLQTQLDALQADVTRLRTRVQQTLESKQNSIKKQRSSRQRFEDYQQASWSSFIKQCVQIPLQFYHYVHTLTIKMMDHYLWADAWPRVMLWIILGSILLVSFVLRRVLRHVTQEKARSRFSGHLFDGALLLFYRSLPQLAFVVLVLTSLSLMQVAFAQAKLLFNILLIWMIYRQAKGVARLILLERVSDNSEQETMLYRRLTWLFLMGAWSTGLMMVGQELPLSFLLQDIFNRLFMVFLLGVAWVLWESKDTFPALFHPWFHAKQRPVRHFGRLLGFLIPAVLLTTAVIGLVGYINLAWMLSRYQAYFLLVLTAYVLLRELLSDLLDLLSEWMVSKLHNGWLWVEAILKPLETWFHVGLGVLGVFVLFRGFKHDWEFRILANVKSIGTYPFLNGAEIHVTLFSSITAFILLMILIWLAKWTREFCYRWLYRGMVDAAIRNSVSVFTQYTIILLGAFLFLRVLGIDLTGMGMVFGGLAVGMGFGLRDFASNIVGGLMLLIERPVREGDLITLGEYEGRVAHIGIRSMRISSWDHMDVLIPNAETFNKPVTNWTHQDGVVRTVLPIKVNRSDSPTFVQQLIMDVLDIIPEVLKEPPAQVYLKQIDEALLEFEVRYFLNIQFHTRFAIRSKVLFAIMAQFEAAGIKPPIPPFRVEIKSDTQDEDKDEPYAATT